MFGHQYYHSLTKKYVTYFGTCFNDIHIIRYDDGGVPRSKIAVPIVYAPTKKFLERLTKDPKLDRKIAISLPRMSFELTAITYSGERKISKTRQYSASNINNSDTTSRTFSPVYYDLNFTLQAYVKNNDDGAQIMEQILPFFTPSWVAKVNTLPDLDISESIPIDLVGVTVEDSY